MVIERAQIKNGKNEYRSKNGENFGEKLQKMIKFKKN